MMDSTWVLKKSEGRKVLKALKSQLKHNVESGLPVISSSVTIEAELAPGIPRTVNVSRKAPCQGIGPEAPPHLGK
jgi:hypothetical protein